MVERRQCCRKTAGALIAETGPTLWALLMLLTFPLLDLATVTLRYTFLVAAARDAAHVAARAKSFYTNISAQDLSSVNGATQQATMTASAFSEITVTSVTTRIVVSNISTGIVTRQTTVLTTPADTSTNLYEIEVAVAGRINPLITFATGVLPGIPGLSAPMPVTAVAREFCESPQGLTQ